MSYLVYITNTATGEQRVRTMDLDWNDGSDFWWSDGNFGCDCNRADVFEDNANECVQRPCGYGRYRVRCVTHDGTTLYEDAPRPIDALTQQAQANGEYGR